MSVTQKGFTTTDCQLNPSELYEKWLSDTEIVLSTFPNSFWTLVCGEYNPCEYTSICILVWGVKSVVNTAEHWLSVVFEPCPRHGRTGMLRSLAREVNLVNPVSLHSIPLHERTSYDYTPPQLFPSLPRPTVQPGNYHHHAWYGQGQYSTKTVAALSNSEHISPVVYRLYVNSQKRYGGKLSSFWVKKNRPCFSGNAFKISNFAWG